MARREFSKAVQRDALNRADYRCEAILPTGDRCPIRVGRGQPVEYDHVLPDSMGGEPTLENCAALCKRCHQAKTAADATDRARADRRADAHNGIRDPHRRRLRGKGFPTPTRQTPATGKIDKWFGPGMEPRP